MNEPYQIAEQVDENSYYIWTCIFKYSCVQYILHITPQLLEMFCNTSFFLLYRWNKLNKFKWLNLYLHINKLTHVAKIQYKLLWYSRNKYIEMHDVTKHSNTFVRFLFFQTYKICCRLYDFIYGWCVNAYHL